MTRTTFDFERVISPVSKDTFFASHYEKAGLRVHREDPGYYAPILSTDRIDEYLTTADPHASEIMLVNAEVETEIPSSEYTLRRGVLDIRRVYQLFAEGATLVMPQLHRKVPELAGLCRAVEAEFHAPFQTNIYLTPPEAQGFKTHYDTHDVFVLQVEGNKEWHVYDTPIDLPLLGQKFDREKYETVPESETFLLQAGDLYYCPRGIVHNARSTDTASLHITFGLMAQTWSELMFEAVAQVCLADPAFRENLPVGYASDGFDREPARAKLKDLLTRLCDSAELDPLLDTFAARFIAESPPHLRGQMAQVLESNRLTVDSIVTPRESLIFHIAQEEDKVVLVHFNNRISFPSRVMPSLEALLASDKGIRVRDAPGELDEGGLLVLARKLVSEGLLTRAA
ncbi:MAG: cupin domain-containing protein [Alphaproteobacteria bacterium]|jgi:ribosomal protein L16 Arg81 hydroxylase|nr:cupin domain-containing protein [Alphaproteobacteria bacterium]